MSHERTARWRLTHASAGMLGSLALHGLALLGLSWAGSAPDVGIEFQLPNEVEFGVAEVATLAPEPPALPPESEPPIETASAGTPGDAPPEPPEPDAPPEPAEEPEAPDAGVADAGADAATDAGVVDAGADAGRDAGTSDHHDLGAAPDASAPVLEPPDAAAPVASNLGTDAGLGAPDAGPALLSAYAPQGAQLALRLHMGRIRDSPLAGDIRGLLEVVPDWQALLRGSGIDALNDLERLYLASPNLKRSSLVVAGQYLGDESLPRRAVARLAQAKGVEVRWKRHGAFDVAPWENEDSTQRVLALIGPQLFTITRPDDLPRVMQVAQLLAQRLATTDAGVVAVGDALLALRSGETLALSVEGARAFVAGGRPAQQGVPERLDVSVSEAPEGKIVVQANGLYDAVEQAEEARRLWTGMRDRVASHPLVSFVGMRGPLKNAEITTDGAWLRARGVLTLQQARVLIGFVANALKPPPGPAPRAPGTTQEPGSTSTGSSKPPSAPPAAPIPTPTKPRLGAGP